MVNHSTREERWRWKRRRMVTLNERGEMEVEIEKEKREGKEKRRERSERGEEEKILSTINRSRATALSRNSFSVAPSAKSIT